MGTYVLVHGGGLGGWCYQPVAKLLREAGHDVYTPTLTGLGERAHLMSPDIDLETHIDDVTAVLRYEDLRETILVGHSYGGMVVTGAADRATDRTGHLVYLDSATPINGESLVAHAGSYALLAREDARWVDGVELVLWPETIPAEIYGVTDPDDAAWMKSKLTPHPWNCFEQPLQLANEAELWALPQTLITCSSWLSTRDPSRCQGAQSSGRVWDIDTGHLLMLTEPKKVADMLLRLA